MRWFWEGRFRFPLSGLGLAVTAAALWVFFRYGADRHDMVLRSSAAVVLLLVATSITLVLFLSLLLWLRLRKEVGLDEFELECHVQAATGYSFPRFGIWPLVQIRVEWATPAHVDVHMERTLHRIQELVRPTERGAYEAIYRRFIVADIFGLSRFALLRKAPQRVRILPGSARASSRLVSHFTGGDGISHPLGPAEGDLLEIRRYAQGDPLRFVLWKAFARTRQLLVRTAERAISPSPSAMAYFIAGPQDEASAGSARLFLEQGWLGEDFLFQADGAPEATSDTREAIDQLIQSRHARHQGAASLGRFLEQARRSGRRSCILFLPAAKGPWLSRLEKLRGSFHNVTALLAVDGNVRTVPQSPIKRILFHGEAPSNRGLASLMRRLSGLKIDIRVVHRATGDTIPTSAITAEDRQ